MPLTRAASFGALARELATKPTLAATLQAIVEHAATNVPGAEHAAITIKRGKERYQTVASTGQLPLDVDAIQYRTNEGPCLQALELHHVFRSDELATDPRWPVFGREAAATTEVVSMMSHRLFLEDANTIGALNLYSPRPAAFSELELTALDDLATHCAIALASAAEREQNQHLRAAVQSNRDIGVAIGILMATKRVTQQQAFDALRIASQHTHRKLHQVALDVVETGELPRFMPVPKSNPNLLNLS
jgi:GAF domain-containing protein